MFFLLKTTLKTGRYQASTVHMSPPGFGMCRLLVWPHVLSWFCHVSFFLFGHMFFPGTSTCLFPIYNPRAIFLFCTRVLYKFSHMAFICLAACQFTICEEHVAILLFSESTPQSIKLKPNIIILRKYTTLTRLFCFSSGAS